MRQKIANNIKQIEPQSWPQSGLVIVNLDAATMRVFTDDHQHQGCAIVQRYQDIGDDAATDPQSYIDDMLDEVDRLVEELNEPDDEA